VITICRRLSPSHVPVEVYKARLSHRYTEHKASVEDPRCLYDRIWSFVINSRIYDSILLPLVGELRGIINISKGDHIEVKLVVWGLESNDTAVIIIERKCIDNDTMHFTAWVNHSYRLRLDFNYCRCFCKLRQHHHYSNLSICDSVELVLFECEPFDYRFYITAISAY
jgi:hypothetical protein